MSNWQKKNGTIIQAVFKTTDQNEKVLQLLKIRGTCLDFTTNFRKYLHLFTSLVYLT